MEEVDIRKGRRSTWLRVRTRGWIEESRSLNETHWPIDSPLLHSYYPRRLFSLATLFQLFFPAFVGVPRRRAIRNSISCLRWQGVTFENNERVDINAAYIQNTHDIHIIRMYIRTNECLSIFNWYFFDWSCSRRKTISRLSLSLSLYSLGLLPPVFLSHTLLRFGDFLLLVF